MNVKLIEALEKNYCVKCGTSENVSCPKNEDEYRCEDCYSELLERRKGKEKRYAITIDFYVYADNDIEAIEKASTICEDLNEKGDMRARIIEASETPFASGATREIVRKVV